jgi:phosphatidylethanolamine-binding protein (PEBP) family uncharacterized protein
LTPISRPAALQAQTRRRNSQMAYKSKIRAIFLFCIAAAFVFSPTPRAEAGPKLVLESAALSNGSPIPVQYTCAGDNQSPPLHWSGVPKGSRALALIVSDPDAPGGTFVHWVIYNIPASRSSLPKAVPAKDNVPGGGVQGLNSRDNIGYHGP